MLFFLSLGIPKCQKPILAQQLKYQLKKNLED
jgi:hypothetical protein